jgi:excisionase family DNA binding protein
MPSGTTDVLELLTTEQTAARTGLSVNTLLKHRKQHRGMPFVRIGRTVRYRTVDVEAFLVARTVVPGDHDAQTEVTGERGWTHPALRGGRLIT